MPHFLTLPHILYSFQLWFSLLLAEKQKKQFVFIVSFTFFDWVAYNWIFYPKVPFIGLLTLMVIFHALKDKRRVLVLRKRYNIWVGREMLWKRMWADEGFCGRQGQCRGLGQQSQRERGEHRWNHFTFTLPLYLCGQRVFFRSNEFRPNEYHSFGRNI